MAKKNIEQPDGHLGYLLTQVSFLKQRIINAAMKELDITYIQFLILAGTLELADDNGIVTQQTIATKRRLDKAMVSNVVKTLIDKGLVKRYVHPADKRAFSLSLTEKGNEKALAGRKIARSVGETFFAKIDKEKLMESLTILLTNEISENE